MGALRAAIAAARPMLGGSLADARYAWARVEDAYAAQSGTREMRDAIIA